MASNSDYFEDQEILSDSSSNTVGNKQSLKLRLVRALSSGTLKSPKKSLSVSSSQSSSPVHSSPFAKARYSWQSPSYSKECHIPHSLDSGVSLSSLKSPTTSPSNSLRSSFTPQSPRFSIWYTNER